MEVSKETSMPKSLRNYEKKNNAWNIRRLVDESFIPSTQRIILKIVKFFMSFFGLFQKFWFFQTNWLFQKTLTDPKPFCSIDLSFKGGQNFAISAIVLCREFFGTNFLLILFDLY